MKTLPKKTTAVKTKDVRKPDREGNYLSAPETRVAEWINLASFGWWTLLLLLPSAHLFAVTPSFSALAARGDERHWGLWTLAATLLALTGLVTRRPAWRVLGLAAAAALWAFVSVLIAMGAPALPLLGILLSRNTGVGLYAILGVAGFVCAILLSPYLVADLLMALGHALLRPRVARSLAQLNLSLAWMSLSLGRLVLRLQRIRAASLQRFAAFPFRKR